MRTLLALFVASCNALILQPHRTRTQLRSDPRGEAIEVVGVDSVASPP